MNRNIDNGLFLRTPGHATLRAVLPLLLFDTDTFSRSLYIACLVCVQQSRPLCTEICLERYLDRVQEMKYSKIKEESTCEKTLQAHSVHICPRLSYCIRSLQILSTVLQFHSLNLSLSLSFSLSAARPPPSFIPGVHPSRSQTHL